MYGWTQKYVGIPFASGGRDITGCDCYGLIRLILSQEYNIHLPALNTGYTDALNSDETKSLFSEYVPVICGVKLHKPEEKAICLVRTRGGLCTHVGIYAGDGFIMHTRNITGAVCERIISPYLTDRIEGWYHVNQINHTVKSFF